MRISVVGTGYVGLVSGVCLAATGHDVVCVDNQPDKVRSINAGIPPIHEAGLTELLEKHVGVGVRATEDLEQAVLDTDLTLIAVGTPFDGRRIDLRFIETVSRQIGAALAGKPTYHVVVVKSTVIPGTTDGLVRRCLEESSGRRVGADIGLGMNPEFLTEGQAVADFMNPDRIVIGGIDSRTTDVLEQVYAPFATCEVIRTNNKTAEMIKYASNALLATMISFSNELGSLCSELGGVDVVDVLAGVHASAYLTSRDGSGGSTRAGITAFLGAGCGFGGSCLPKDVQALAAQGMDLGLPMSMLNSVIGINRGQPERMLRLIRGERASLADVPVTVLGVAFKPDTDDVRESPAIPILEGLLEEGAKVTIYDPVARLDGNRFGSRVTWSESLEAAVRNAAVVVIVTAWDEFRNLPRLLDTLGIAPRVVDGRRILPRESVTDYAGIGLS